jgi:hypothetical protein
MSDHPDPGLRPHDHLVEPVFGALLEHSGPSPGARELGPGRLAGPAGALLAGLGLGLALVQIVLWMT